MSESLNFIPKWKAEDAGAFESPEGPSSLEFPTSFFPMGQISV